MLVRITAPHFVAALVIGQQAAPIIGYMRNWTLTQVQAYCARKRWTVEVLTQ